jgi:Flp pilus assembly protein TadG
MIRKSKSSPTSESGFVIILFFLVTAVLMTFLAFAIDMGKAYDQQRQIQISADAASLAAISTLGSSASYTTMLSTVGTIALANGITMEELMEQPPRCGTWNNGSFVPQSGRICNKTSTAVEVTIKRSVPTHFARMTDKSEFNLTARSVGYMPPPAGGSCIRPFGIEESYLSSLDISDGDTFSVSGNQGSGTWGKVDIAGNASSGEEFTSLMLTNMCDEQIVAGNFISVGTGDAAINQVFESLLSDSTAPYSWQNMVFAVTSDFGNGNGTVQIRRFIRVDLLSQQGQGRGWAATFRIVELDSQPDPPIKPTRQLMQ